MVGTDRRPQLDLAADAGRGRIALVERLAEGGGRNHDVGEVARLDIGERIDLPRAAGDEADAGVLPLAHAVRALEAQGPFVVEDGAAKLDFRRGGQRRDGPQDRKGVVEGKSVSVRVDLGGRRIIKKKTKIT